MKVDRAEKLSNSMKIYAAKQSSRCCSLKQYCSMMAIFRSSSSFSISDYTKWAALAHKSVYFSVNASL